MCGLSSRILNLVLAGLREHKYYYVHLLHSGMTSQPRKETAHESYNASSIRPVLDGVGLAPILLAKASLHLLQQGLGLGCHDTTNLGWFRNDGWHNLASPKQDKVEADPDLIIVGAVYNTHCVGKHDAVLTVLGPNTSIARGKSLAE